MPKRSTGQANQPEKNARTRSPYEVERRRPTAKAEQIISRQNADDERREKGNDGHLVLGDAYTTSASSLPPNEPQRDQRRSSSDKYKPRQQRLTNLWTCSIPLLAATVLGSLLMLIIIHAFVTRQLDSKGCGMCWSRPLYVHFKDFDTEHTRFASKYSLYMIKEGGIDEDPQVG